MKTIKILTISFFGMAGIATLLSCRSIPEGAIAVSPFNIDNYLGKWYEIARLDHRFEKNMNNVTAEYSLNEDGTIKVINSGYDFVKDKWKQAEGKAKLAGDKNVGKLKVSFFGPFYSAYNIIALDEEYKYVLVSGKNTSYLWILSREKTIPDIVKQKYLSIAEYAGFKTNELIWVDHN